MAASGHLVLSLLSFFFFTAIFLQISSHSSYMMGGRKFQVHPIDGGSRKLVQKPGIDCGALCATRCSLHSRPNTCTRACGTCCFRCGCVPPGTFGNREMCGSCYANMTTHDRELKCP